MSRPSNVPLWILVAFFVGLPIAIGICCCAGPALLEVAEKIKDAAVG